MKEGTDAFWPSTPGLPSYQFVVLQWSPSFVSFANVLCVWATLLRSRTRSKHVGLPSRRCMYGFASHILRALRETRRAKRCYAAGANRLGNEWGGGSVYVV